MIRSISMFSHYSQRAADPTYGIIHDAVGGQLSSAQTLKSGVPDQLAERSGHCR